MPPPTVVVLLLQQVAAEIGWRKRAAPALLDTRSYMLLSPMLVIVELMLSFTNWLCACQLQLQELHQVHTNIPPHYCTIVELKSFFK